MVRLGVRLSCGRNCASSQRRDSIVEELRQKLSEANGELVTTGEVFEYISARKVPFEMVRDIIVEMTSEGGKFYKMQGASRNVKGKIANLTDAFQIMMANIGEKDGGLRRCCRRHKGAD